MAQGLSSAAAPAVAASTGCPDIEAPEANQTALPYHRHGLWPHLTRQSAGTDISRDVHVVGGLLPTPNIAAQAGSIDPIVGSMAANGWYQRWYQTAAARGKPGEVHAELPRTLTTPRLCQAPSAP